jgi:transmembrane sensor
VTNNKISLADAQIIEELAQWLVMIDAGELSDAEAQAWEAWKNRSEQHRKAWLRAEKMDQFFSHVPANISTPILKTTRKKAPAWSKLVLLLAVGGIMIAAVQVEQEQAWLADYRTGFGEQRNITLEDGTQIVLNSRTAIDIDFSANTRTVVLRHGEIFIHTGHPAERITRPFYVQSQHGTIQALGTQFNVAQDKSNTSVAVVEHAVQINTAQSQQQQIVNEGQALEFKKDHISHTRPIDMSSLLWKNGLLIANSLPLQAFAEQIERYYNVQVAVTADAANIMISGTYPINDLPALTAALEHTYHLQTQTQWLGRKITLSTTSGADTKNK